MLGVNVDGNLAAALKAMRQGIPVLVYDNKGREDEVDYVVHASFITAKTIYEMRTMAGGLICYAMPLQAGRTLGLRYAYELLSGIEELKPLANKTLGYGDKPAFSIWVNSVRVKTGIRDNDRAATIRLLDRIATLIYNGRVELARRIFVEELMSPGHVPILLGRRISERAGHTELSLHLAMLAGMTPSTVIVEVLGQGEALSLEDARRLSKRTGYPLVEGTEIVEAVNRLDYDLYCRYNLCESRHG